MKFLFLISLMCLFLTSCLDLKKVEVPKTSNQDSPSTGDGDGDGGGGDNGGGSPVTSPDQTTPAPLPNYGVVEKMAPQKKGPMVPRTYVAQVLREILTDPTYVVSVEVPLDSWVMYKPTSFGLACNVYGTYGGKDCSGGATGTTGFAGNQVASLISTMVEGSTVRQLNKMQVCDSLFSTDTALRAAANRIDEVNIASSATPSSRTLNPLNDAVIAKMFSLFFRGRDISSDELSIYRDFNSTLLTTIGGTEASSRMTRWRALFVMMCESPEWEIL